MKTVKLNNGLNMPVLGLGVYQIPEPIECERVVSDALSVGYRLIDTAAAYNNEQAVGNAIKKSDLSREELFITTKVFLNDIGYERTKASFAESLKKLQLDYLDLYLIHQPYGDVYGSWRAMQELYREGKIRAIGVSNFTADRVMDFIEFFEVPPAVNQIETHPFNQQQETGQFLKSNGVQLESWGPLAQGKNGIFNSGILTGLANTYDKSVAQIVIRWLIQRDVVVIPKSTRKERMAENIDVFDFRLTAEDMAAIKTLDTETSVWGDHRDPARVKMLFDYAKKIAS
jgi:2,5-diketo-D-gluconate reductase A